MSALPGSTPAPIRAVIWDIGGVLVRLTNTGRFARWEQRMNLAGGTLPRAIFASKASARASLGKATTEDVWRAVAAQFSLSDDERRALRRDVAAADTLDDALVGIVVHLRPRYKTALLSNAWLGSRAYFTSRFALDEVCDLMVFSAEEGIAKPDPRIFRLAADQLGVPPAACVFVDDYAPNVASAVDVGMVGIRYESAAKTEAALRKALQW